MHHLKRDKYFQKPSVRYNWMLIKCTF
jgi:hypothetical protein